MTFNKKKKRYQVTGALCLKWVGQGKHVKRVGQGKQVTVLATENTFCSRHKENIFYLSGEGRDTACYPFDVTLRASPDR